MKNKSRKGGRRKSFSIFQTHSTKKASRTISQLNFLKKWHCSWIIHSYNRFIHMRNFSPTYSMNVQLVSLFLVHFYPHPTISLVSFIFYIPPQKYFSHKNMKMWKCSLGLILPGNRRSLSCSKHKFMSVCTILKNVLMFQSEHSFFAIVATYKRMVWMEWSSRWSTWKIYRRRENSCQSHAHVVNVIHIK